VKAIVMSYFDTTRQDYRSLIDVIDADGERHPAGAARGGDKMACVAWAGAILQDHGFDDRNLGDVRFVECEEMAAPSFERIRTNAAFKMAREDAAKPAETKPAPQGELHTLADERRRREARLEADGDRDHYE
jgi:hypothetical protein